MAAQILAVIIFIVMFGLIIWDHIERHIVSLGCGLLTLVLVFGVCMHSEAAAAETLSLRSFMVPNFWFQTEAAAESSSGINWATILFIAGMMLMVEGMERAGFFRWLCLTIAKAVHYKTIPIFISFMLMSAFLAMFIDSITVILFLAAVTVELAHLLHFDPIPMIISEIFCSNLGGSATMCGDPPNIIIGTSLGYSFKDFMYGDNVIEKHGINRDRTGDREKTRYLCGKQGIFTRDRALIRPGFIRQLETRASTRSASFFHALGSPGRPHNGGGAAGAYRTRNGAKPLKQGHLRAKRGPLGPSRKSQQQTKRTGFAAHGHSIAETAPEGKRASRANGALIRA